MPCHYRSQRKNVARADVVLFAGGAALSDMPPEWTARKLAARLAVVDPETGEIFPEITVASKDIFNLASDPPPPFDLVFVDEPVYAHQVHGLEKPLTEIAEADLTWLAGLIRSQTCPAPPEESERARARGLLHLESVIRSLTTSELPEPELELEPAGRARQARNLLAFARPLLKAAPGFVTYGDVREGLSSGAHLALGALLRPLPGEEAGGVRL